MLNLLTRPFQRHTTTCPAGRRRLYAGLYIAAHITVLGWSPLLYAAPKVAVSVSPVHSLISGVMQGAGTPELLIPPGHSPHVQSLSPSAVRTAYDADLLIWVGSGLEVSMSKIVDQIKPQSRVKSLIGDAGLEVLPVREQAFWNQHDEHGHDEHDEHDEYEEHGDDEHEEHGDDEHDEHGHDEHGHEEETDEDHGHAQIPDPHIWLSTSNAIAIVSAFSEWISQVDADNSQLYRSNADAVIAEIHRTRQQMEELLEPIRTVPYVVFHDAYQYYENENGLNAQTSVSRSPDHAPAVRQIQDLQQFIRERGVRCVFREPQFESRIIATVIEDSPVKVGVLDPLGAGLTSGPDMWHQLMLAIATSLHDCLSGEE